MLVRHFHWMTAKQVDASQPSELNWTTNSALTHTSLLHLLLLLDLSIVQSMRLSLRLHAHLSQITAIVRLCCSVRQLQLSKYTCRWENRITGQSMPYPGTLVGAVPISTSGNRNTSGWPLYVTSCLGIQERWRTKSETKLHLCTLRIWCTW